MSTKEVLVSGLEKHQVGGYEMEKLTQNKILTQLASLLDYPYESKHEFVNKTMKEVAGNGDEATSCFEVFSKGVINTPMDKLEELYVSTFDVQSVCSLDVGYLLFGEEYKRGQFMAQVHKLHRENNNSCGTELPDYLPNMLRLIQVLPEEDAKTLVHTFIYPAIIKMEECFTNVENFYKQLLSTIKHILHDVYQVKEADLVVYLPVVDKEEICSQM